MFSCSCPQALILFLPQVVKLLLHKEKELSEQTIQAIARPKLETPDPTFSTKEAGITTDSALSPKKEVKMEEGACSPAKSLNRCLPLPASFQPSTLS